MTDDELMDFLESTLIDGYLTKDITNMLEFKTDDEFGQLGCPLAFSIFSGMEFLGYLLGEGGTDNTENNITYYVDEYLRDQISDKNVREELGKFWTQGYRHGIHHHFLPKPTLGISKESTIDKIMYKEDEFTILNAYVLGKKFLESLSEVKERFLEPEIRSYVCGRYAEWEERNKDSFPKEIISSLESLPQVDSVSTTTWSGGMSVSQGTKPPPSITRLPDFD